MGKVGGGSFLHSLLSTISPGLLELGGVGVGGYGVGSVGYWVECVSRDQNEGFTKSVGTLSPEQDGGHTQPGGLGHEGKAVLCGYRDQSVGRGLLRPSETMQRGFAQVRIALNYFFIYKL